MKQLPEHILKHIDNQINEYLKDARDDNDFFAGCKIGYKDGYWLGSVLYAKKWQQAEEMTGKMVEVLKEFISMHETGLLPNRFTYLKGKEILAEWENDKIV